MPSVAPSVYALRILSALQDRHMYAGTVPAKIVARRRAAGRVARKSRKLNRQS